MSPGDTETQSRASPSGSGHMGITSPPPQVPVVPSRLPLPCGVPSHRSHRIWLSLEFPGLLTGEWSSGPRPLASSQAQWPPRTLGCVPARCGGLAGLSLWVSFIAGFVLGPAQSYQAHPLGGPVHPRSKGCSPRRQTPRLRAGWGLPAPSQEGWGAESRGRRAVATRVKGHSEWAGGSPVAVGSAFQHHVAPAAGRYSRRKELTRRAAASQP